MEKLTAAVNSDEGYPLRFRPMTHRPESRRRQWEKRKCGPKASCCHRDSMALRLNLWKFCGDPFSRAIAALPRRGPI